jgi:hypothetical protein
MLWYGIVQRNENSEFHTHIAGSTSAALHIGSHAYIWDHVPLDGIELWICSSVYTLCDSICTSDLRTA